MVVFHSDLDNTLIYSYKHDIGTDKVCVEVYQDREISFMTSKSYKQLQKLKGRMLVVPTTTRTEEQYKRIVLGEEEPEYALVCNGGILLVQGQSDEEWYAESLRLIADCKEELRRSEQILQEDAYVCFEIRNIRELFIFTKSEEPELTVDKLKDALDLTKVDIFQNGSKVYVVPKALSKGKALERFQKRVQCEYTIAAGDSGFDIPMLNSASVAIAPEQLVRMDEVKKEAVVISQKQNFAEGLLDYLLSNR